MTRNLLALLIAAFVLGSVCEAAPPTNEPKLSGEILKNTFSVFTLTEAQDRSLDAIISKFPDLRQDATMARIEFNQAFGPAIKAVDEFLTRNSTPEWDWATVKREAVTAALGQLDLSGISRQQALDYIATVRKRTKGDIPQRIYNVLITFHPVYQKSPHMEMVNGYLKEYRSDGSGKSLGIRISLEYPMSWKAEEGRRPHILQNFSSPVSPAGAMIYVNEVPLVSRLSSDQENLEYLSSREYIEKELGGAGFISAGKTTIAGKNASFCNTIVQRSAPAGDVTLRTRIYYILHREKIVSLSFDVSSPGLLSLDDIEPAFKRCEKLFELMATSLDFLDKYESSVQPSQPSSSSGELISPRTSRGDRQFVVTKPAEKRLPALLKAFGETWLKYLLAGIIFATVAAVWAKIKRKKKAADTPNNRIENDEKY